MLQVVLELSKQLPDVRCVKVEAEEVAEVSERFGIDSVPAFVFLQGTAVTGAEVLRGANPPELSAKALSFQSRLSSTPSTTPVPASPSSSVDLEQRLRKLLASAKVMAFIKGTAAAPQCGFSRRFVALLQSQGILFASFNVLSDPEVRDGLKKLSNWPTYPQLYINGELVGGLDVCTEMAEAGELRALVPEDYLTAPPAPATTDSK